MENPIPKSQDGKDTESNPKDGKDTNTCIYQLFIQNRNIRSNLGKTQHTRKDTFQPRKYRSCWTDITSSLHYWDYYLAFVALTINIGTCASPFINIVIFWAQALHSIVLLRWLFREKVR
jgi:hypothetical protein